MQIRNAENNMLDLNMPFRKLYVMWKELRCPSEQEWIKKLSGRRINTATFHSYTYKKWITLDLQLRIYV